MSIFAQRKYEAENICGTEESEFFKFNNRFCKIGKENRMSLSNDNKSLGSNDNLIVNALINAIDCETPIFVEGENSEAKTVYDTKKSKTVFSKRFDSDL